MKKSIWWIVGIVVVVLIVISVTNKKPGENVIKVGAVYALTGPAAVFGEISAKGVRDAVTYFKQKEGIDVQLFLEDSANDPKQGVSAAQKMFDINKVRFAVVGTSGITNAISPLADQYKALLITDAAGYGLTKDKTFLFQNFLPSLNDVAKQLNSNEKWKRVALVYINDEFGNIWYKKTSDALVSKQSLGTSFAKDAKDFKTEALKIKQFNPDVMFVLGYGPALNQVYADLALQGVKSEIISYLSCTLPGVLSDKRYSLEGNFSYEYPLPLSQDIVSWIKANNGESNTFYDLAFENTLIALIAAKESGNDPIVAKEYLKDNSIRALYGDVIFNSANVSERDLKISLIKDNKCQSL